MAHSRRHSPRRPACSSLTPALTRANPNPNPSPNPNPNSNLNPTHNPNQACVLVDAYTFLDREAGRASVPLAVLASQGAATGRE